MTARAKKRRVSGRAVLIRALSIFLALLIVSGTIAALLDIV